MSDQTDRIPKRLRIARRWQWLAAAACVVFLLTCFVGWPFGSLWPSLVALIGFIPSVWLFNTRCYKCGFHAFADFQADERRRRSERVWTRFSGEDYGGLHLPLGQNCTKCGSSFF